MDSPPQTGQPARPAGAVGVAAANPDIPDLYSKHPFPLSGSRMVTKAHGHSTVHWLGNVCISTLDGAFNQEGAADWVEQLQQTWQQQGQPTPWAHVVDMEGWLGRTPESTELMREGIAWAESHGLRCTVLVMAQGARNIFLKINQASHPVIAQDADVTICENHKQAIELLHQRGFILSLLQLSSRKRIRHTASKPRQ